MVTWDANPRRLRAVQEFFYHLKPLGCKVCNSCRSEEIYVRSVQDRIPNVFKYNQDTLPINYSL